MPRSTITGKGQTTVPIEIRAHLGLEAGDMIEFVKAADGSVRIEPVKVDIRSLKGSLRAYVKKPVSVEAMKAAVRKRFRKR
jgi:antitoxin PrlF